MARNDFKIILLIFLISLLSGCSIPPTYSRKDIEKVITKICKEEFNLEVRVEEIGDTLWIYAPFKQLLDKNNQLEEKVKEDLRRIFLSLERAIFNMDKPPQFYAFVASDIEKGVDVYYIGFIPDFVKLRMGFISLGDFQEREISLPLINPGALGDKTGQHIKKLEINLENFVALLIQQKIRNTFLSPQYSSYFEIKNLEVSFEPQEKSFNILIDISQKEYKPNLPKPFEESLKIAKHFILEVYELKNFSHLRIEDLDSGKIKIFSKKALEESILQ